MKQLMNKHILVGVSGGIAAYKTAELVRRLGEAGAQVRVVMTHAASQFVTPLTFQALSGNPVHRHLLDSEAEAGMGHIQLARWGDALVVAPATADFLAKAAQGRGDDLLSTVLLAFTGPVAMAPAMNQAMWANAATQDNVAILRQRGIRLWGPGEGEQACGDVGLGRMWEPQQLLADLAQLFDSGALTGVKVLITAGPTREAIDPVRYLSNRSSGKMGYALATAAREAGAQVSLVSGPVALPMPVGVEGVGVESAAQMYQAVMARAKDCDIFIGAAAVADYQPFDAARHKIKKDQSELMLGLTPTQDILAGVAALDQGPFTVGFAAETEQLLDNAEKKRHGKGVDMVAANLVGEPGMGFEGDDNALLVLWQGGQCELPRARKAALARQLIVLVAQRFKSVASSE